MIWRNEKNQECKRQLWQLKGDFLGADAWNRRRNPTKMSSWTAFGPGEELGRRKAEQHAAGRVLGTPHLYFYGFGFRV